MLLGRGVGGSRGGEEGWEGEEVAGPGGAVGDEGKYLGYEALLDACVLEGKGKSVNLETGASSCKRGGMGVDYQLGVELGQPGLALAIEDQECVDHVWKSLSV